MYSTHNEGTSVVAEMNAISKKVYIDKLDDKVHKYNNRYHSRIKMELVDVKTGTYIDSNKQINNNDPKFNTGDTVRVSKYRNVFAKGYVPN